MEQHQVLLEWIEQQRCEMASDCASTEKDNDDRGLSEQATSTALRNHTTTRAPGRNRPSNANGHKRKRLTEVNSQSDSCIEGDQGAQQETDPSPEDESRHNQRIRRLLILALQGLETIRHLKPKIV